MGDHLLIYLFLNPVLKMDVVASSGSSMELERRKGTSHNCWELGRFSKLGVKTPHLLFFSSAFQQSSFSSLDGYLFSLLCLLYSSQPSLRFCFCVLKSWSYCLIFNNFPILRFSSPNWGKSLYLKAFVYRLGGCCLFFLSRRLGLGNGGCIC